MRFFVEVTPIGKTDTQKYCVDAESWQKALMTARAMRKEDGSISGFSIELADDGYRAVDPTARIRYMVKKAPADASVTTASTAPPPVKASVAPPAAAAPQTAAHPAPAVASISAAPPAHPISVPPPRADDAKKVGSKTVGFSSSGAALLASSAPAQPAAVPRATGSSPSKPQQSRAPAQAAPAAAAGLVTERKKPESLRPMPIAAAQPPTPVRSEPPPAPVSTRSGPPIVVLYRKEQMPTAASPITYREEVFAAPPGTSEEHAEAILRAEFRLVTNALVNAPAGKYVNLAVFDRVFEGRPPAPPLATLSWKDWKPGEPSITFPRRQREKLSSATQPSNLGQTAQMAQVQLAQVVAQVASNLPQASSSPPAHASAPPPGAQTIHHSSPPPANAPPMEARAVAPSAPPPRANVEPHAAQSVLIAPDVPPPAPVPAFPPPHVASAPPPPMPEPVPFQAPVHAPAHAPAQAPAAAQHAPNEHAAPTPGPGAVTGNTGSFRRVRKPTPSAPDGTKIRVRGDELIALLFEEMHDLSFMADALEGAAFCLWVVLDKLPSKAAFVHFYDLEKREFVVASVAGVGVEHVARRNLPNDPWLAEAMQRRATYVVTDASGHEGANVERFAAIGGARSLIVAPVMLGGRMLGAIEVVNPVDGNPFGDDDGNAIQYMAEQFAEFVSSHGMVIDETRIRRASPNPPA